jgi:hypothetical protein
LPAPIVKEEITPRPRTRRRNRISLRFRNIAVFASGILSIKRYGSMKDFSGEGFNAF